MSEPMEFEAFWESVKDRYSSIPNVARMAMREAWEASREQEREACARLCDIVEDVDDYDQNPRGAAAAAACAVVIRSRK